MTPATVIDPPIRDLYDLPYRDELRVNPWVSDQVLLSLSLWWVRMTRPEAEDMVTEVAIVFNSLQDELQ